jgi:hypothetical protein
MIPGGGTLAQRAGIGAYRLDGRPGVANPVFARAERTRQVALLVLQGKRPIDIARELGIDVETVKNDVVIADALLSTKLDKERLRSHQTGLLLTAQDVALERYLSDGNTVEGRLVADYGAGLRKLHGLEETDAQAELGGALARLLGMAGDDE